MNSAAALGTLVGGGIRKLLTKLKLVVASGATIFVDWHLPFLYLFDCSVTNGVRGLYNVVDLLTLN